MGARKSTRSKAAKDKQNTGPEVYCICRKPDDHEKMIGCNACPEWYHIACLNITSEESDATHYICATCTAAGKGKTRHICKTCGQKFDRGKYLWFCGHRCETKYMADMLTLGRRYEEAEEKWNLDPTTRKIFQSLSLRSIEQKDLVVRAIFAGLDDISDPNNDSTCLYFLALFDSALNTFKKIDYAQVYVTGSENKALTQCEKDFLRYGRNMFTVSEEGGNIFPHRELEFIPVEFDDAVEFTNPQTLLFLDLDSRASEQFVRKGPAITVCLQEATPLPTSMINRTRPFPQGQ